MSDTVDTVMEEYMSLEPAGETGKTLHCKQCGYHPASKKGAVQFLVGMHMQKAPKGHI
jgi:hypothetical protein